ACGAADSSSSQRAAMREPPMVTHHNRPLGADRASAVPSLTIDLTMQFRGCSMARCAAAVCTFLFATAVTAKVGCAHQPLQSADYFNLQSVGAVVFSPDGSRLAYIVQHNDAPGRPYSQLWILDVTSGRSTRVGDDQSRGSSPVWSPDGRSLAFLG